MKSESVQTDFIETHGDLLESILPGIIITDIRGIIVFWNSTCERVLGYNHTEIVGKPLQSLFDDAEMLPFSEIMVLCQQETFITGRWHAKCKDHSRIGLDTRVKILNDKEGEPQACIFSFCNIPQELESAVRDLERTEALAETILETSADGIFTADNTGTILSFNRAAERIFGYQKEGIIGKHINVLLPTPYRENIDTSIFINRKHGKKNCGGIGTELHGLKKDGTVFPMYLSLSEVSWHGNRIIAGLISDLTQKRKLKKKILEIGNEERRRIGRDLNDSLGQTLDGIRLISENLAKKLKTNNVSGADEVKEISEMVLEADEFVRTLSRGLVQVDLEKMELSVALQKLSKRVQKNSNIECKYVENGNIKFENHRIALHIYRIVQEAVNNAIKHADANCIEIRISSNLKQTTIAIDDDGKGFDPEKNQIKGSGIQIMKYRTKMMGGTLDISRVHGRITRIRCIIPTDLDHF